MVCFRVSPHAINRHHGNDLEANEFNSKLLESVNATGIIYMTHSMVEGAFIIRFSVGATLTEDMHIKMAWELVQDQATSLLGTLTPKADSNGKKPSKQIEDHSI
ncbi:unnamed protein product [Lactuca virosa]|uniref:Tyrosine decarboxylase n=1 Tax=Lactuca virosa TaxID=75947 RepID=A0AAU9PFE5_9ASTR|nr:unnamed protein product [Lactuca virosa]